MKLLHVDIKHTLGVQPKDLIEGTKEEKGREKKDLTV